VEKVLKKQKKEVTDILKQRDGQRAYNKWIQDKYANAKIKGRDEYTNYQKKSIMKVGSFEIDNIEILY
jgi:hypothetical protein